MLTRMSAPNDRIRTHLANERTFLSWVRTSVSLVALGIGVAAFLDGPDASTRELLALGGIGAGLAVLMLGFHRYRVVRWTIEHGDSYHPMTRTVTLATFCIAAVACVAAVVVVLHN